MGMLFPAWARRHPVIGGVVFLFLGILIAWVIYFGWHVVSDIFIIKGGQSPTKLVEQRQFQATMSKYFSQATVTPEDLARINVSQGQPTLGDASAKVHIVGFFDFQCPFSKEVAPTLRAFMKTHASDAPFIFRDYPIRDVHPDAERVAVAARCVFLQGNQDAFWGYFDRLYASQDAQTDTNLRLFAQQAGVDLSAYDTCIANPNTLSDVQRSTSEAIAVGSEGTPTFFFNGVKVQGAMDAVSLETIFQEAKKKAL